MANRVCLGSRGGGDAGLFISKPGFNVLTAGVADMLFSSSAKSWQIVSSGQVSIVNDGSFTITHPNLGYYPTIVILPHMSGNILVGDLDYMFSWVVHLSNTQARLHFGTGLSGYSGACSYCVMRLPANG